MQLVKFHIVKHSEDPKCRQLYQDKRCRKGDAKQWNGVAELEERERHLVLDELANMRTGQTNRQGLGYGKRTKRSDQMTKKEKRNTLNQMVKEVNEDQALTYLYDCAKQGNWLKWDTVMNLDTAWNEKLYLWNPCLLSFRLNSIQNTLPTQDNLHLWKKVNSPTCQLCFSGKGTLHHTLSNCKWSLDQGRYTWRHDEVLKIFSVAIKEELEKSPESRETEKWIPFVPEGKAPKLKTKAANAKEGFLAKASDWRMLVDDIDDPILFPPEIATTNLRPDIIIWSEETKCVILIELTVPDETNLDNAHSRKSKKYSELVHQCQSNGWETRLYPIEVGTRGYVYNSVPRCLRAMGMSTKKTRSTAVDASKTSLRCSYFLYLNRNFASFKMAHRKEINEEQEEVIAVKTSQRHTKPNGESMKKKDEGCSQTEENKEVEDDVRPLPNQSKKTRPDGEIISNQHGIGRTSQKTTENDVPTMPVIDANNNNVTSLANQLGHNLNKCVRSQPIKCGLYNLGNTCFINSCIQMLCQNQLTRSLLDNSNGAIAKELCKLKESMKNSRRSNPIDFINQLKPKFPIFTNKKQHDAQEFLAAILNTLEEENKSLDYNDVIHPEFGSQSSNEAVVNRILDHESPWYQKLMTHSKQTVQCLSCGVSSASYTDTTMLSIDAHEDQQETTLCDLISQRNSTTEAFCRSCQKTTKKKIEEEMKYAANTIIIHLKRFSKNQFAMSKIQTDVIPKPTTMMIKNQEVVYQVTGVISHSGSLNQGHYRYHHQVKNKCWLTFNDDKITGNEEPPKNGYIFILNRLPEEGDGWDPLKPV